MIICGYFYEQKTVVKYNKKRCRFTVSTFLLLEMSRPKIALQ